MSSLFIVNSLSALEQCLPVLGADDGLLLIEDAVSACLNTQQLHLSEDKPSKYYILEEDCVARGLTDSADAASNLTLVDYPAFVALSLQYSKTVSWL